MSTSKPMTISHLRQLLDRVHVEHGDIAVVISDADTDQLLPVLDEFHYIEEGNNSAPPRFVLFGTYDIPSA